jgi:hypothetical protein
MFEESYSAVPPGKRGNPTTSKTLAQKIDSGLFWSSANRRFLQSQRIQRRFGAPSRAPDSPFRRYQLARDSLYKKAQLNIEIFLIFASTVCMESHISQSVRNGTEWFPARRHLHRPVELARQNHTNCAKVYDANGEVNYLNSRLPLAL